MGGGGKGGVGRGGGVGLGCEGYTLAAGSSANNEGLKGSTHSNLP